MRRARKSLYTGISTDVNKRLLRHNEGKASKYTRSRRPLRLIYAEDLSSKSQALKRECEIKSLSKKEKDGLIKFGKN
ncbi:MAG: GIY-YIG nuclease family protein [Candidatus Omnitrophota bacterium]